VSMDPEIGSRHLLGTDGLDVQPNAVQQFIRIVLSQITSRLWVSGRLV